ncbi:hypothetical protein MAC_03214 [Metarhizium acridum CQMa 102]|uniref:Uncharacterized protein n=1 Tax=Metarhizium acridum (strain CQMa 102) TaxID=655827 RepID=E9E016_METAQ|nr:uncharacterized protein MAC_03214 [Metarhizium acridum CQMa 102]EFY90851.1 hypothetical protein MAC_03214 [Metarhizium acridum CQMa 102]
MDMPETDDVILLKGCYLEAYRSDDIALKLEGLRIALNEPSTSYLAVTVREIGSVARRLRELADIAQVNRDCLAYVLDPLNIVLPCLSKSLRDIKTHYDRCSLSKENRWRNMYHCMKDEKVGFSSLRVAALAKIRPNNVIQNTLFKVQDEKSRASNTPFTRGQGNWPDIALTLVQARRVYFKQARLFSIQDIHIDWTRSVRPITHWAEHIFSSPWPRTPIKNAAQSFDGDKVSLIVFLNSQDDCAYLLLRMFKDEKPWFSLRGAHELCIKRRGNSLQFRRWSMNANNSKIWARLCFNAWEDIVLMYCTFVSLKARNHRTLQCGRKELALGKEKRLFQAYGPRAFTFSTRKYTNQFLTEQARYTNWIRRGSSRRKVWLSEIRLFVFCKQYREHSQRKGPAGEFQINFVSDRAAEHFESLFYPFQLVASRLK